MDEERRKQAVSLALRWLARREHCGAEVRKKLLARGFSEQEAEEAIELLIAKDWLSEDRFAEAFLRARIQRGDAPRLAAHRALLRGADQDAVERVLARLEARFDAEAVLSERIARLDPDGTLRKSEKGRARLFRRLQRRGFSPATIRRVLDAMKGDES